jgi:filamentous hemagglutinin family protein
MVAVLATWTVLAGSAAAASNIEIDGSLPGVAPEALVGDDYLIPATKGVLSGDNLFFSFSRFNLDGNESATFSGPGNVSNIFSRVTGSSASRIDGTIRSTIDGADFYLMNPNGVIFGENARLDLNGAFRVTTADTLTFTDGSEFSADASIAIGALSTAPLESFGFLSTDPRSIELQGGELAPGRIVDLPLGGSEARGKAVALVGGDILIDGGSDPDKIGQIFTGGARLDIASLDSPGTVRIIHADPTQMIDADLVVEARPGGPDVRLGDVRVFGGAALVTGGPPPQQGAESTFVNGSGDVFVRARHLTLEDSEIRSLTTTARAAGRIDIDLTGDFVADGLGLNRTTGLIAGSGLDIQRQDPSVPTPNVITFIQVFPEGVARIRVERDASLDLVRVQHIAQGIGGEIDVDAESISILNGAKISSSGVFGGSGGSIDLEATQSISVAGTRADGAVSGVFANALMGGDAGSIAVRAESLEIDDSGGLFGEVRGGGGQGGTIEVDVDRLRIANDGQIDTTTRGTGAGGSIDIVAREGITIVGKGTGERSSRISTISEVEASGSAGSLRIDTPQLVLRSGGLISSAALGSGDAGTLDLRADTIDLAQSAITSAAASGSGGNIFINGGPLIRGPQGELLIDKPPGVESGHLLLLDESEISTSVTSGVGGGGDIVIDSNFVVSRDSRIIAQAVGGAGGNIRIVAGNLLVDDDTTIDASSEFSQDGRVLITSSGVDIRGDVATLPATIVEAAALLRARCSARVSGEAAASFVIQGRDGLSASPEDYLPASHRTPASASHPSVQPAAIDSKSASDPVHFILGCRDAKG